jgi:predicted enzyme related to lactoylglutathione lyase
MSELRHKTGAFCWAELGTTDMDAAKGFYAKLLEWTTDSSPMGEGMEYTTFLHRGLRAAAGYPLMKDQLDAKVPPHWMAYVMVDNVDATVAKAQELGGSSLCPPMDVFEHGRMAVLKDPQGAIFSIWQPNKHFGSANGHVTGRHCWTELNTNDDKAATEFYTKLFGWNTHMQDMGGMTYTTVISSAGPVGGIMTSPACAKGFPPHWLLYFSVPDCAAAVQTAQAAGGAVHFPPTPIPNVGTFAVLGDPQGAAFAVIQLVG